MGGLKRHHIFISIVQYDMGFVKTSGATGGEKQAALLNTSTPQVFRRCPDESSTCGEE
jgi:hypothetical protein